MANCKECIHSECCFMQYGKTEALKWQSELGCKNFKDRSRFVELPCKVGDTVYVLTADSAIDEFFGKEKKYITKLQVMGFMVQENNKILLLFVTAYAWGKPSEEIGKTVFFTREEAEQALKECEEK